jgi:hypothetical protein
MTDLRDEPPRSLEDPKEILLQQLSYYRATLLAKLVGLSDDQLRSSVVPSGWSPLGLLKHLVFVERRSMQWGFEAEQMSDPRGDENPSGKGWLVLPEDNVPDLTARLAAIASRTEAVAVKAELTDRGRLGGRFSSDPPTLGWIPCAFAAGVRPARRAPGRRTGTDRRIGRRIAPTSSARPAGPFLRTKPRMQ